MTIPLDDLIYFILVILNLFLAAFAVYSWTQVILLSGRVINHRERRMVDKLALIISILNFVLYAWILVRNFKEIYDVSSFPYEMIFGRVVRTFSLIGWNVLAQYHLRIKPEDIIQ